MKKLLVLSLLSLTATFLCGQMPNKAPFVNPLGNFASDPVWKERFIGSYGVLSGREPRITAEDKDLIDSLTPFLENNLPGAITTLESTLQPDSSPALYFILGNFYFQQGDVARAREKYLFAVREFPDFLRVHKNLGLLEFREENLDKAFKHLTRSIELGDTDARTYGLLGYSLQLQEKFLSSEAAFRRAIMAEPENKDWKMLLAQTLLAQGKYKESNALFTEMLLDSPDNVTLWLAQANTYMGLGDLDSAATNFEIVRRMGKATPDSLFLLGDIYMNKQMLDLALEAYLVSVEKNPNQSPGQPIRAAESLTNYGAYGEASSLIEQLDKTYGDRLDEKQELKLLTLKSQIALATGAAEEAAVVLEEIIERDPLNGRALITLANYYGTVDRVEDAVILYERAQELGEDTAKQAYVRHGQLLVRVKRWEEAVDILRRAVDLDPQNDNLKDYLDQVEKVARANGLNI